MILVDTSVLIDYLKKPTIEQLNQFRMSDAALIGVVRAECLTGEKDAIRRRELISQLNTFIQLPTPESLWDFVGLRRTALQSVGISVPFNDIVIASAAVHYSLPLWTRDKQFGLMRAVLTDLTLLESTPA